MCSQASVPSATPTSHVQEFFASRFTEIGAVTYGHYWTYAGCVSPYIDMFKLLAGHPELLLQSLHALHATLPKPLPKETVFVGIGSSDTFAALLALAPFFRLPGHVSGANPLGEILALHNPCIARMYRNTLDQRGDFLRDQARIVRNHPVVIVDDVVSSGRTLRLAAEGVRREGGHIIGAAVLVNTTPEPVHVLSLKERNTVVDICPVQALCHIPVSLYPKATHERNNECPQCASKVPFDNTRHIQ